MREEIIDTGILQIKDKTFHIQTIYPMGRKRPEYKLWYVWEKHKTGTVFASERGFENWLSRMAQPTQRTLW
jgi:hypothetical protein